MRKRFGLGAVLAVVIMVMGAASAQAFTRTVNSGTPGAFYGNAYSPAIEGGICNDPSVPFPTCSSANGSDYYDQIFLNGYHAHTDAYSVPQTLTSTAYLYYYSGGWQLYTSRNMGSCSNRAGGGVGYCYFGSPAEDRVGNNCTNGNCHPVFINLDPRGFSWAVVIRVVWRNYNTGAVLGNADYRPSSTADIGCAYYAQYTRQRCAPGVYNGTHYLYMH